MSRIFLAVAVALVLGSDAGAASPCLNKFLHRSDGPRQVVTLLTGKLTFQEAQQLSASIDAGKAPPLEWLHDDGKVIARQYGQLRVVRPMPVGCDDKPSGVVMIATFATLQKPSKVMNLKLDSAGTVAFQQQ